MNNLLRISEIRIVNSLVYGLNRLDAKNRHKRSIDNKICLKQYFFVSLNSYRCLEHRKYANLGDCSQHGHN